MAVHAGMKEWSNLDPSVVTKDIPPGWRGHGSERTFRMWKADLESWNRIASYDNVPAKISAIEFRVPEEIKEKIRQFPPYPGLLPARAAFEQWLALYAGGDAAQPPPPVPPPAVAAAEGAGAAADAAAPDVDLADDEEPVQLPGSPPVRAPRDQWEWFLFCLNVGIVRHLFRGWRRR